MSTAIVRSRRAPTIALCVLPRFAWVALSVTAAAAVVLPQFLPLYDFDEWVLQGGIVTSLLTGGTATQLYQLLPIPVPNLTAPATIGLLHLVLPIEAAGRAFLVVGVLGFAWSYAFLVRRLQGRPTPLEYTGAVWALGYFLYLGYVSYLFALPLTFLGIALLTCPLSRRTLWWLAAVVTATFLAHLLAWATLLVALLVHAIALVRQGQARRAARLVAVTAPSSALFLWYALTAPVARQVQIYDNLFEKIKSLVEPLQFFMRFDPYPAAVPTFLANVFVGATLAVLLVTGLERTRLRQVLGRPVMIVGIVLTGVAVVSPVSDINTLVLPDQRFLFPAVLLMLAALPWKTSSPRRTGAVAAVVLAVLGLHVVELQSVQPQLRHAADAIRLIPAGSPVTTVAIPAAGGCGAGPGPTIGVPSLRWFHVHRLLADGDLRADLQETSIVRLRFDPRREPGLTELVVPAVQAGEAMTATASAPPWIEVFGCPGDLATATGILGSAYRTVVDGDRFAILRRVE